jgi:hypothetical protein
MSMEVILKNLDEVTKAKRQVAEGQLTIWNARLDALLEAGESGSIIEALASRVTDDINNCGCNVQCGASNKLERFASR